MKYRSIYIYIFIASFYFFCIGLLQAPYLNDKVSVFVHLTEHYATDGGVVAHGVICRDVQNGYKATALPTWAEEPPLAHYLFSLVRKVFPEHYPRVGAALLTWMSVLFLLIVLHQLNILQPATGLLVITAPIFSIHVTRALPDHLVLLFMIAAAWALVRKKYIFVYILLFLACLTKATALASSVALLSAMIFFIPMQKRKFKARAIVRFVVGSFLLGLPFLCWLLFLKHGQIKNPFFTDSINLQRHLGDAKASLQVFTLRYWGRYWLWTSHRGVGDFLFAAAVWVSLKKVHHSLYIALLLAVVSGVLFWMVAVTNFIHPWYTFPFVPAWVVLGAYGLDRFVKFLRESIGVRPTSFLNALLIIWTTVSTLSLSGLLRPQLSLLTQYAAVSNTPSLLECPK